MLAATGIIGVGSRSTIFQQRGANIQGELSALTGFRDIAAGRGWTAQVDELNERILGLTVELQENTRALFDARVEEVNRTQSIAAAAASARGRIAELQGELGIITGDEARIRMRDQVKLAAEALVSQGSGLSQLLQEARNAGDLERVVELEQAILDNTVAQLENNVQLRELEGTLAGTQSFTSTAWQWMRTAIFNGSGGLLPQFQAPLGTGVSPMGSTVMFPSGGGTSNATSHKVVGVEHMEITQNETVDPVALGNKIAWDINTPTV
jgi:hypothetical protein